jgi:hypothetical protein
LISSMSEVAGDSLEAGAQSLLHGFE